MPQILASGKTGANKYDLKTTDSTKVLPRLDMRQIAQSCQNAYEQTQGYSLSGNEGAAAAIDESLDDVTASNISNYDDSLAKFVQTLVANNSYLEVNLSSTANSIILEPRKIADINSPNGNNYSKATSLPFAFRDNLKFTFKATLTNTNAAQIQITGLVGMSGAVSIVNEFGDNLVGGEIVAGKFYDIILTGTSTTKKVILQPALVDATSTVKGIQLLKSNKNAIINGDFNIWQRGTSFTSVADSTYTADRFTYRKTGTMVHDISRSTDVPTFAQAGRLFNYSALIDCQTADASIGSTKFCHLIQAVEGFNFLPLAQKSMTLSFWVKATKTGIYCVSFKNAANNRSFIAEYTINTSDTWEYKTVTIAASPSASGWDYTNGIGIAVGFTLAAGSNSQTTAGAWQTGDFIATANQVNACDSTSNNFRICGVQLEAGSVATPFENRTIQEELALCQRYFEKSYNLDVVLAAITFAGTIRNYITAGQTFRNNVFFQVIKRTTPTITIYNPVTGATNSINFSGTPSSATPLIEESGTSKFTAGTNTAQSGIDAYYHWTASAEL